MLRWAQRDGSSPDSSDSRSGGGERERGDLRGSCSERRSTAELAIRHASTSCRKAAPRGHAAHDDYKGMIVSIRFVGFDGSTVSRLHWIGGRDQPNLACAARKKVVATRGVRAGAGCELDSGVSCTQQASRGVMQTTIK